MGNVLDRPQSATNVVPNFPCVGNFLKVCLKYIDWSVTGKRIKSNFAWDPTFPFCDHHQQIRKMISVILRMLSM